MSSPVILDCIQGEEVWLKARSGIPTASNFNKIYTGTGKASTQAGGYMNTLLGEFLVGGPVESFTTPWMIRGQEMEEEARAFYAFDKDVEVAQVGFIYSDERKVMGCSPDGTVGSEGLLELKNPKASTHVGYLLKPGVPSEYKAQVQGQLLVTGRAWCDFVSYYPGMDPMTIRVARDERFIMGLKSAVDSFVAQLLEKREELRRMGHSPAKGGDE